MASSADPVPVVRGRTLIVAQDGSGDYEQIQSAVDAARPGDTVLVRAGSYTEDVTLRSGVSLRGEGQGRTQLVAANGNVLRATEIEGAEVADLSLNGLGKENRSSIYLFRSRVSFQGCRISGAGYSGIELNGGQLALRRSTLSGNGQVGLLVYNEGDAQVEECTFQDNGLHGIEVKGRGRLRAFNNSSRNNQQNGLLVRSEGDAQVEECTFQDNGLHGITVEERGQLRAFNNSSRNNQQAGLDVCSDGDAQVEGCTFQDNGYHGIEVKERGQLRANNSSSRNNQQNGLFVSSDGDAQVEECTFQDNGYRGIEVREQGRARAIANTIIANSSTGVWVHKQGVVRLERNIIAGNVRNGVRAIGNSGESPAAEVILVRNCLWQNQRADYRGELQTRDDLSADPCFVDPKNGDYHLREDSPCIGAGPNGEDLGAFPFEREPPAPVVFPTTALLHQLRTLPFSHHPGADAAPRRVARWLRCAAAAGRPVPLFLARDLGLLLGGAAAGPEYRTINRPSHLPHDLDTTAYLAFLERLAASPLARELTAWDPPLSDPVLAVILARLVDGADLPEDYRLPGGAAGVVFLRLLGERLAEADPAEIWRDTPLDERPAPQAFFQPAILAQIESNLRRLDPEELRFLSRYGPPLLGSPDPRELLDLLHLTALPRAARLALSQTLKLLPRVSAARTVGGVQTYPEGGYEGLARRGSLDSLLPSELAYTPPVLLHRVANREALYYGRERPRERRRELAYIVAQTGYGLGGDGQVLSKALVLALAQAMRRRGYEVRMSFAGRKLGEPRPLESPSDVARVLYHQEKVRTDETAALSGVLRQLRAWREDYRGQEVLWVLGEHFDADGAGEHRELYRSLLAEAGQQAWFVQVGRRDGAKPPAAARWFERWQVVETEQLWESEEPPEPAILPPVAEPSPEAGDLWRDPVLGIDFSYIPPGTFLMGSPEDEEGRYADETQHRVTLTEGFRMARTPVTQGQFARFVEASGHEMKDEGWMNSGGERHPVVCVSWNDAQEFCRWLSESLGELVRLPSEAEWEYAARAGTEGARYGRLEKIGWYSSNSGGWAHPVGEKQPNAWGLYDMLGNVWEWVEDAADRGELQTVSGRAKYLSLTPETYRDDVVVNPRSSKGERRGVRGGGWYHRAVHLRAASRLADRATVPSNVIGFRVLAAPTNT